MGSEVGEGSGRIMSLVRCLPQFMTIVEAVAFVCKTIILTNFIWKVTEFKSFPKAILVVKLSNKQIKFYV